MSNAYSIVFLFCTAACILGIQLGMQFWRNQRARNRFLQGIHFMEQQNYDAALKAFRKTCGLTPQSLQPRIFLATALVRTGNEKEALEHIALLEELHPNEARAWALICTFYITTLPRCREACIAAFERVKALDAGVADEILSHSLFKHYLQAESTQES